MSETKATRGVLLFGDLRRSGLLWFINHELLHPRGYALGLAYPEGSNPKEDPDVEPYAWTLFGDGSEPWSFGDAGDDERARLAEFAGEGILSEPLRSFVDAVGQTWTEDRVASIASGWVTYERESIDLDQTDRPAYFVPRDSSEDAR